MENDWRIAKAAYLEMDKREKWNHYQGSAPIWQLQKMKNWQSAVVLTPNYEEPKYPINLDINATLSLIRHDITAVDVDVIVNAANSSMRGGGGVDGAIHRAAGPMLLAECKTWDTCRVGEVRLTGGYELPAKYVIHAVGPVGEYPEKLRACYMNSLHLALKSNFRSIAFPCISTGMFGYPNEPAAHVALEAVRQFLDYHGPVFSRIVFCVFTNVNGKIYERLMQVYFPRGVGVTCKDDNDSS